MTLIDRHALADMLGLDADYVRDVLSKSRGAPVRPATARERDE